jgi:hypothetical protein
MLYKFLQFYFPSTAKIHVECIRDNRIYFADYSIKEFYIYNKSTETILRIDIAIHRIAIYNKFLRRENVANFIWLCGGEDLAFEQMYKIYNDAINKR